jgi:hypothetical protein
MSRSKSSTFHRIIRRKKAKLLRRIEINKYSDLFSLRGRHLGPERYNEVTEWGYATDKIGNVCHLQPMPLYRFAVHNSTGTTIRKEPSCPTMRQLAKRPYILHAI